MADYSKTTRGNTKHTGEGTTVERMFSNHATAVQASSHDGEGGASDPTRDSTTTDAAPGTSSRFLDLPAELRNRIYTFTLSGNKDTSQSLELPALSQVNRQLRHKCLFYFFNESPFYVYVGTKLEMRVMAINGISRSTAQMYMDGSFWSTPRAGTLGYEPNVLRFLESAGDTVRLRDISFRVYDTANFNIDEVRYSDRPGSDAPAQEVLDREGLATLRITVNLGVEVEVLKQAIRIARAFRYG